MAEESEAGSKKKKSRGSFWTRERIILATVFVAGLLLGAFIMQQYISPLINSQSASDYNALLEQNALLDEQADAYYSCLLKFNIRPEQC